MDQVDFNRLWQNFVDTISKHYVDFEGRVGRAQFWYYIAVYFVIGIGVSIIGGVAESGGGLRALYGLALLLPTLGITARRLHDTGRTASWVLLLAIPWALAILLGLFTLLSFLTFGLFSILFVFMPIIGLIFSRRGYPADLFLRAARNGRLERIRASSADLASRPVSRCGNTAAAGHAASPGSDVGTGNRAQHSRRRA